MNRAEMKRKQKEEETARKKLNSTLKRAGIPGYQMPLAPIRMTGLSTQEVANITGAKIAVLEQWRKEQQEEIRKAAIMEAQEKLDKAEEFITLCNVITSLKALEGFRYAKAAANYLLEHYTASVETSEKQNIRKTYEELHEKWGLEIEFDEPDLNKEMGFDAIDWRYEYIGYHIPTSVYEKIWDDSKNIQSVFTQLAIIWELCEDFGFHKHKTGTGNMIEKFMKGATEKYDNIDRMEHGAGKTTKLLKQKYGIDIKWTDNMQKTIDRFRL